MRRDPQVVVVGGGPAGSTTALLLARHGREVVLLERAHHPRPKPCGECIGPGGVAALARLGLLEGVLGLGPEPLRGWRLRTDGADVYASFGEGLHGLGLPRSSLDRLLVEAARLAGVHVVEGARVLGARPARTGARPEVDVLTPDGSRQTLAPGVVVGADGLRSIVVRSLGLVAPPRLRKLSLSAHVRGRGLPEEHGLLHVSGGVTLGVAPVGGGLWNVTAVTLAPPSTGSPAPDPAAWVGRILRERLPEAEWEIVDEPRASGPFDRRVRRAWAPGVVLVGDAAGYFDPFTGQGIYRALRTAELGAEAVLGALEGPGSRPLRTYDRRWRREVAWSRRLQRAIEALMTRPRMGAAVLRRLDASGGLASVIRVTGDVAAPRSLLAPGVWLGRRHAAPEPPSPSR